MVKMNVAQVIDHYHWQNTELCGQAQQRLEEYAVFDGALDAVKTYGIYRYPAATITDALEQLGGNSMSRKQAVESRIKDLEQELVKLNRYGEDRFRNGTVLKFKMQFNKGGIYYTYAALKADGKWFLTGARNQNQYLAWDLFVEFLARANDVKGLKMATAWEGI